MGQKILGDRDNLLPNCFAPALGCFVNSEFLTDPLVGRINRLFFNLKSSNPVPRVGFLQSKIPNIKSLHRLTKMLYSDS